MIALANRVMVVMEDAGFEHYTLFKQAHDSIRVKFYCGPSENNKFLVHFDARTADSIEVLRAKLLACRQHAAQCELYAKQARGLVPNA